MNNERLMVMRNKIENVGLEDCGVDGGLVAEIIDELIDSRFQIESLTAERDEAREEIERLEILCENDGNVIDRLLKEKIRLVQLFRFWVIEYSRLSPGEVIRRGEYIDDVQEIRELLEE